MQKIKHGYKNIHPLFDEMEMFYSYTSQENTGLVKPVFSQVFKPLSDLFKEYVYDYKEPLFLDNERLQTLDYNPPTDNVMIVCCSGGKDSVATALHYISKGYQVILYHIHGINKVYYDEFQAVKDIADILNCPYVIDEISLSGNHMYVEHPMKNFIIANGAISFAIQNNLPLNIAFGNYYDAHLDDNQFNVCAGDTVEMWGIYTNIVQQVIHNFYGIWLVLQNTESTISLYLDYIINKDSHDLLEASMSCISPYRFRNSWRYRTQHKYNVTLMPNRCGCCWKCAMEYIYLTDLGILDYVPEYYEYCLIKLADTIQKETGEHISVIREVWDRYMFHDITKSKMGDLSNAVIQARKVKFT